MEHHSTVREEEKSQEVLPKEEEITVHVYDSGVEDNFQNEGRANIHLWCLDQKSEPYLLRVIDFPVVCHLEFPRFVNGKIMNWDKSSADEVIRALSGLLKDDKPKNWKFEPNFHLYYYRRDKQFPMALLSFDTLSAMQHLQNLVNRPVTITDYGTLKFEVWETSVNLVRKFFSFAGCRYSQWFKIMGQEIVIGSSHRVAEPGTKEHPIREYIVRYKTLTPLSNEESKGWSTCPRLLAFDIETYSDNHRAMPNHHSPKHVAYMVSAIYKRMGDPNSLKRYAIIYGDCDEIPGSEVIKVKSEAELVHAFCKLIKDLDPEIITGYNILSYDYPYLDIRLRRSMKDWSEIGRIMGKKSIMTSRKWKSSAYGYNRVNILQMDGRISIDMLPIVKRDYKLDKYDLDFVSKHFLKKGKHDIKAQEMFKIFEEVQAASQAYEAAKTADKMSPAIEAKATAARAQITRVMAYCIQDSELVVHLFEKLNTWIGLVELSSIVGVTIMELFTRGQQVRCLSQIYNLASKLGYVLNRRPTVKMNFSGGFVFEPKPGLYENIICLDFASLYPSIMEAYNICFSTLVPSELEDGIPDAMCNVIEFDQEEDPDAKMPSDTHETDLDYEPGEPEESGDAGVEDADADDAEKKKTVTKHYRFKFIKAEHRRGILPQLVHDLVAERNAVKKQMKGEPEESISYIVLDKRQGALKVSANSMFGFLGAQEGGVMSLIEGAMSITAMGRHLIGQVNDFLKEKYNAEIVYNDTDSSMVDLHIKNREECDQWGKKLALEISGAPEKKLPDGTIIPAAPGLFPPPLRMEFEKAMRLLCLKKKKYAAKLINKDGSFAKDDAGKEVIMKKGIVLARRDNSRWLRSTYEEVLTHVLDYRGSLVAFKCIVDACIKLLSGTIKPKGNLTIIRTIGSDYKSSTFFMKVFGEELTRMGKPANPGDRLEYVVVKVAEEDGGEKVRCGETIKVTNKVKLGQKMRSIEMFEEAHEYAEKLKARKGKTMLIIEDEPGEPGTQKSQPVQGVYPVEEIDYLYYIEHFLVNSIDQLYSIAFDKEIAAYEKIGFKPRYSTEHYCSIKTPTKMISKLIKDMTKIGASNQVIIDTLAKLPDWYAESRGVTQKKKARLCIED